MVNEKFDSGRREFLKIIPVLGLGALLPTNLFASQVLNEIKTKSDGLPDVSARNVTVKEGTHLDENVMYIEYFYIDGKKSGTVFFEKQNAKWQYIGKRPAAGRKEDRMSPKALASREKIRGKKIHLSVRGPFVGKNGETEGYSVDPYIDPSTDGEFVKGDKSNTWDGFVVIKSDGSIQMISKSFLLNKVNNSSSYNSVEDYLKDMVIDKGHSLFQAPLILGDGKPGANDSSLDGLVSSLEKKKQLGFYQANKHLENYIYLAEFNDGRKGVIHFNDTDLGILEQTAILQQKLGVKNALYLDSHLQGKNIGRYRDAYGEQPIGDYDFDSEQQINTGGLLEISC